MGSQDQTPQGVLRRRVREFRERRGWNQTQLAEEVTKLGTTMHQTTIAKIENQSRDVTINEALLLAAALNVPPPLLFIPLGTDDRVEITSHSRIHPHLALDWLTGERELATSDRYSIDQHTWAQMAQPLHLYQDLRRLEKDVIDAGAAVRAAEYVKDERKIQAARRLEAKVFKELHEHRETMVRAGVKPPKLAREWTAKMKQLGLEGGA
jgi:transcriptional regulator with XRE-family HTH domain